MNARLLLSCPLLVATAFAQVAIYPPDYVNVAEGPFSSSNLPLARGTSRVMCLYEADQLTVPVGNQITRLGFREDGGTSQMDMGRALQLEVRMGYTTNIITGMSSNFDNNYSSSPVTVFGPALYNLPNLRDPNAPLPNGQFFITLTTPFSYSPGPGENLLVEYRVFGTSAGGGSFTYRIDRADYFSQVSYGPAGCQHAAGGPPTLTVQPTRPGLSYSCSMAVGPANSVGVLAVSIDQSLVAPYPLIGVFAGLNPACEGQLAPIGLATIGGITNTGGSSAWSFGIPNDNAFANISISSQALFLDFFSPGGLVVSQGAEVVTGLRPRCSILAGTGAPTVVQTGSTSQYYCPVAFFEHQ